MKRLLFIICALMALAASSCIEDGFTTSSSDLLNFSTDTVSFDTVFTDENTSTRRFLVYNPHKKQLNIEHIYMSDSPEGAQFFLNVDGRSGEEFRDIEVSGQDSIYVCKHKVAKPRVFIPVFPGTNCEYDSTRAFERAGAEVDVKVFKNLTAEDIHDSVELFEKAIDQAQIIMFPGGFSAGDEPDGSAKFFATAFQNAKIKEAVMKLINERDGLALGICNGFQALIKLGLVPYLSLIHI